MWCWHWGKYLLQFQSTTILQNVLLNSQDFPREGGCKTFIELLTIFRLSCCPSSRQNIIQKQDLCHWYEVNATLTLKFLPRNVTHNKKYTEIRNKIIMTFNHYCSCAFQAHLCFIFKNLKCIPSWLKRSSLVFCYSEYKHTSWHLVYSPNDTHFLSLAMEMENYLQLFHTLRFKYMPKFVTLVTYNCLDK